MNRGKVILCLILLVATPTAIGQSSPEQLKQILYPRIQSSAIVEFELRQYLSRRVPNVSVPASAADWTNESKQLRRHLLNDVVFHGWPEEWLHTRPRFEDVGLVPSKTGLKIRKLRYEIVPGFWSSAILYEPMSLKGKIPAILVLNGHGPGGKAIEYKQKLCINYARMGILTLSLEWFGFGELSQKENAHDYAAALDLVGANAIGLFYLNMRRGLDYLYDYPNLDRERLGVTGLSGGGWQTIVLSALDERVSVAVPVAGYGSLMSNIVHPADTSEIEEDATDFRAGQDYTVLTAMRAPRPTLLIYNAEDDCCFRAPFVKADIYDDIKPFFRAYGQEDALAWHENIDPGTHNYEIDNRQQSYKFIAKYFHLPTPDHEIPVDTEINGYDDLVVGLPQDNLTVLGLAKRMAQKIRRAAEPSGVESLKTWADAERGRLTNVVRYKPVTIERAWMVDNSKHKGVESISYHLEFSNRLSATAVWMKAINISAEAPITIVLDDRGKNDASAEVSSRVNRGEQVVAVDLLFTGDAKPESPSAADYALILASVGDRPLGLEAAQLVALGKWFGVSSQHPQIRIESTGMRSQMTAMIASAIEPTLFSEVHIANGIHTLRYLLDQPVAYRTSPDLFCLDIYKEFELDRLALIAEPTKVSYNESKAPSEKN